MKKNLAFLLIASLCACINLQAQNRTAPQLDPTVERLLGGNQNFSGNVETSVSINGQSNMSISGKMYYSEKKLHYEINLGGGAPQFAQQLAKSGMDKMTAIVLPEQHTMYLAYPRKGCYVEMPLPDRKDATNNPTPKITEVGAEVIDGHKCIKNKVEIKKPDGEVLTSYVWLATDLNKFPIKVEVSTTTTKVVTQFKDISLQKPAADLFTAPAGLTKYASMQEMFAAPQK